MLVMSMAKSTDDLEPKIKQLSIIASILSRKARDLDDKLKLGDVAYNPYSKHSLGRLTEQFDQVIDLAKDIADIAHTI